MRRLTLLALLPLLMAAQDEPVISVTQGSASLEVFSPNGDGNLDEVTYDFDVEVRTDSLYPEDVAAGEYRWKLAAKLTIDEDTRTLTEERELTFPHPPVDEIIAAKKADNDNSAADIGTEIKLVANKTLTLPAGQYYLTRLHIGGKAKLEVTGRVIFYVDGPVELVGQSRINDGGDPNNLWIVQAGGEVTSGPSTYVSGVIYAPLSLVKLAGNTEMSGAVVGLDVVVTGTSDLHHDIQLRSAANPLGDQELRAIREAVYANRSFKIAGNAVIDSYDSSLGGPGEQPRGSDGDVRCLGPVAIEEDAKIFGDVFAGGAVTISPTATVSGEIKEEIRASQSFSMVWDGLDDGGNLAQEGPHTATLSVSLIRQFRPVGAEEFSETVIAALEPPYQVPGTVILDVSLPEISNQTPAPDSWTASARPTISASYRDEISAVDVSTVKLVVDGADVTAKATVTGTGISYVPDEPLADGKHNVELRAADLGANEAVSAWKFFIDTTPPVLILSPETGTITLDTTPALAASYSDAHSGVDTATFQAKLDGANVTSNFTVGANSATYTPPALFDGPHTFWVRIADRAGNVAEEESVFKVVSAMKTVGPEGGTVEVTDPSRPAFGAKLEIPAGATDQMVVFTIEHVASPPPYPVGFFPAGPVVDFGPSTSFSAPVTITIPYDEAAVTASGVPEEGLRLIRFDESLGVWVLVPILSIDTEKNLITAQVTGLAGVQFGAVGQEADPDLSEVEASPTELPADGISFSTVTIIPRRADGGPLGPNQAVTAELTGVGTIEPVQDLGDGTYRTYVRSSTIGTVTVTVTVNGTELTTKPQIVFIRPFPDYFQLDAPATLTAGQAADLAITAKLDDGSTLDTFTGTIEVNLTGTDFPGGSLPDTFFAVFSKDDQGVLTLPNALVFAKAGTQLVKATLVTNTNIVGSAQVEVEKGPPAILEKIAGDGQKGPTGTILPQRLVVRLTDLFGNAIDGTKVKFEVESGDAGFVIESQP